MEQTYKGSTAEALDVYFSTKVLLAELKHKDPALGYPYSFKKLQKEFVDWILQAAKDALEGKLSVGDGVTVQDLEGIAIVARSGSFSDRSVVKATGDYCRRVLHIQQA